MSKGIRRLRFDRKMEDDESIPGAIAKGVREHVLERTKLVLQAAEVPLKHLGWSQLCSPEELTRLAFVARCDSAVLHGKAGERVVNPQAKISVDARFGTLVIPRPYLELNSRRIAPVTLRKNNYHRLSWLNLLLPYCTESLEMLVSRCSNCDASLGWHCAWGIESCESCRQVVEPSPEPPLPSELASNYRLFSQLVSFRPTAAQCILEQLPTNLQTVQRQTLVKLVLQLGGIVQSDSVDTSSRRTVVALSEPMLASIAASGTRMLITWPDDFRTWVAKKAEELESDPQAVEALRRRLKRLADPYRESAAFVALVNDALPDLELHRIHAFPRGKRHYIYQEVGAKLGASATQMDIIRELSECKFRGVSNHKLKQGRFDADYIDSLVKHFRDTILFEACAWRFKLPLYAIDQLCAARLLIREDHPAVLAVRNRRHVRMDGVTKLCADLVAAARTGTPPPGTVSLATASKRIGGRLKPWSGIIDALRSRQVPLWLRGSELTIRSIHVYPDHLSVFDSIVARQPGVGLEHAKTLSQIDIGEILNIKAASVSERAGDFGLSFESQGRALVAPRDDTLNIASKVAWRAEIELHLAPGPERVETILAAKNIRRCRTGWLRSDLAKHQILPKLPQAVS